MPERHKVVHVIEVEYRVHYGYAGHCHISKSEAEARAFYENEAEVPSYLNRSVKQPVTLTRVTTQIEILENNRP